MNSYKSDKRGDGIVRRFDGMGVIDNPNVAPPHTTEGEILFLNGSKFKATKIDESQLKKGGKLYVYVSEI